MFETPQAMYELRLESIRSFESVYLLLFFMLIAITVMNLFLYGYLRLCHYRGTLKELNKNIKFGICVYGFFTLCLSGWIFFAEDRSMSLRCYKQEMSCDYFRSTHFNKIMKFSASYDFSDGKTVSITHHRNMLTDSFFTLKREDGRHPSELPMRFHSAKEAEKEAGKFNAFLAGETDHYLYKKAPVSSEELKSRILIPLPLLFIFLQLRIFAELVVKAYGLKIKR